MYAPIIVDQVLCFNGAEGIFVKLKIHGTMADDQLGYKSGFGNIFHTIVLCFSRQYIICVLTIKFYGVSHHIRLVILSPPGKSATAAL